MPARESGQNKYDKKGGDEGDESVYKYPVRKTGMKGLSVFFSSWKMSGEGERLLRGCDKVVKKIPFLHQGGKGDVVFESLGLPNQI
jgi:hypothetical protein